MKGDGERKHQREGGRKRRGEEAFQEKVSYEKCFSEVGALK